MSGSRADRPRRLAALWTLAVALLLLAPLPPMLQEITGAAPGTLPLDKLVHVALFALLAYAWLRAARPAAALAASAIAAAVIAYGGLLELLQPVVSARGAEWGDLAADAAGAALALGLVLRHDRERL